MLHVERSAENKASDMPVLDLQGVLGVKNGRSRFKLRQSCCFYAAAGAKRRVEWDEVTSQEPSRCGVSWESPLPRRPVTLLVASMRIA